MVQAAPEKVVTGAENVVWDLSIFYDAPDDPRIDKDMKEISELADQYAAKYAGKVAELDAEGLVKAVEESAEINDRAGRMMSYASLGFSTDTNDPKWGALYQKANEFYSRLNQKMVFFELEWVKVDDNQAGKLLADPALAKYSHMLEAERRYKPYQLTEGEEKVLLAMNVNGRSAWTRFFSQLVSTMRFDYDGEELNMTDLLSKLYDPDREIRRKAADSLTTGLKSRSMELTYIFNVLASDKATTDEIRSYPTWITSRNLANKAPDSVVEALIEAVTSSYDLVARHYELKRTLLGLDELTEYDRYAPLPISESDKLFTWDEARDIVVSAFNAFHEDMGGTATKFFEGNWIHAKLLPNKRGGAYASPTVPSAHPFVFLNYNGQGRDVETLAHELGHGIHMYMGNKANDFQGLYTPLTTAEMASVFGEMLVFSDLMEKEEDPEAKLAMLIAKIEGTFATVFRQISMNRFEHAMHTARREEGELTAERLSALWMESQKAMFGDSVNLRDDYGVWWSYIPHFLHTPGYVYAYSFGELLVLALYNLYQQEGPSFAPKYLDVLAAGNSDYPDKILAKVGVDLNDPSFWQNGLEAIRKLIDQEEALAKQVYPEKFS